MGEKVGECSGSGRHIVHEGWKKGRREERGKTTRLLTTVGRDQRRPRYVGKSQSAEHNLIEDKRTDK